MATRPCSKCGGSGTNPPGKPEYETDPFSGEIIRFAGWSYLSDNTAPIPPCEKCDGTGSEPWL